MQVHTILVLAEDAIVTGGEDGNVFLWAKDPETELFALRRALEGHESGVRAATVIPAGDSLPDGGFATACLKGKIHVFNSNGDLVRRIDSGQGGIVSLDKLDSDRILAGGNRGNAKVWHVGDGSAVSSLDGQETMISVLVLPSGDIVTGSTGRRDEAGRHVDYKLRLWRGGVVVATKEEHTQAIRDLAMLPNGESFVSVSNDGTIRSWGLDLRPGVTFPVGSAVASGRANFLYNVAVTPSGLVVASGEDQAVHVVDLERMVEVQTIPHPALVWSLAALPSGQLLAGTGHAGASGRGHVYVWTTEAAKAAPEDSTIRKQFLEELESSRKPRGSEGKQAEPAPGSRSQGEMEIRGSWEERHTMPGQKPNEYALFRTSQGKVWVCQWNAVVNQWVDVGEFAGSAGDGNAAPAPASAGGKFDIDLPVELETPSGLQHLRLQFNQEDNPLEVAYMFMRRYSVSRDQEQEILNFIYTARESRGWPREPSRAAPSGPSEPVYSTFPDPGSRALDMDVKFDKLAQSVLRKNEDVISDSATRNLGLSVSEQDELRALIEYLQDNQGRQHAATFSEPQAALVHKLMQWPVQCAAPVLNLLRVIALYRGCVDVFRPVDRTVAFIVDRMSHPDGGVAHKVFGARALQNLLTKKPLHGEVLQQAVRSTEHDREALTGACGDVLGESDARAKGAAVNLLYNFALVFVEAPAEAWTDSVDSSVPVVLNVLTDFADAVDQASWLAHAFRSAGSILVAVRDRRGRDLLAQAVSALQDDDGFVSSLDTAVNRAQSLQGTAEEQQQLARVARELQQCLEHLRQKVGEQ